jgi:tetratricopeptide (TPR) repeat protein
VIALVALLALQAGAAPLPLETYSDGARDVIEPAYRTARERPGDASAQGRLGMALQAWEQWEHAHEAYERAQRLAPDVFDWQYLDGIVLLRLARPADAARKLRAAADRSPASLPAREKLGEALLDAGDLDASRTVYAALADEPRVEPIARLGLGRISAQQGRHDEAVKHLERAVELFPDFGAAHYTLARAYRALGRDEDARRALARHQAVGARWPAVEDPLSARVAGLRSDAASELRRGVKLADEGDLAGAIAAHEAAVALNASAAQARANLISLYGRTKNWAKAEEHYQRVVETGYNLDEAHYNYAVVLVEQQRWDEAEATLRKAIAANPLHARARNNLGQMLERTRRVEDALAEYRRAIESEPSLRIARFNAGRMLIALGRDAEAVTALEPLRTPRDAETPRYLFALATAHLRAGRRDEGIAIARDARQLAAELGQTELAASIDRDLARLR